MSDDIEGLMIVENMSFSIPWSKDSFIKELDNDLAIYFVAKIDDIVVGYIGMWKVLDEGHITNIAVHSDFRKLGIGSKLIEGLIAVADQNGIKSVTLEVRKSNFEAIKLYSKHGFVVSGVRKGYYQDNSEDAVILWKF